MPLPAIAPLADGDAALVLKIEDDADNPRVLIQHGDRERPEVWDAAEFRDRFAGRLLLMTSRERMAGASRPFDISWFIPALVKYRRPLRDVLIASFCAEENIHLLADDRDFVLMAPHLGLAMHRPALN